MKQAQISVENYLKTIYALAKDCAEVREIDVAQALGLSRASVCRAVKRLQAAGYLLCEGRRLRLTPAGEETAQAICDRHQTVLAFLHKVLKVPYPVAKRDACYLEHLMSPQTYRCLRAYTLACAGPGAIEAHAPSLDPIAFFSDPSSCRI